MWAIEKRRQYGRDWYAKNRELCLYRAKQYAANSTPEQRQRRRAYRRKNYNPEKARALWERTKEARKATYRIRRSGPEGRIRYLLTIAKKRAKVMGLAFDLCFEDLEVPAVCPVLGMTLHYDGGGVTGRYDSASLDRTDSSRGYIRGNVRIISLRANRLKSNATAEELRRVADYVRIAELLS